MSAFREAKSSLSFFSKSPARVLAGCVLLLAAALGASVLVLNPFDDGADGFGVLRVEAQNASRSIIVVALPEGMPGGTSTLVVVDQAGNKRAVGSRAAYQVLALSPDGERIAAVSRELKASETESYVHFVTLSSGTEARVRLSRESVPLRVAWSPDGDLAAVDGGMMYVIDEFGRIVGKGGTPPTDGPSGVQVSGGGFAWTADSRIFCTIVNGEVRLFDRKNGRVLTASLDTGAGTHVVNAFLQGFTGDNTAVFAYQVEGEQHYAAVSINASGGIEIERSRERPPVAVESGRHVNAEQLAAAKGTAGAEAVTRARPTSDGNATLAEVRSDSDASSLLVWQAADVAYVRVDGLSQGSLGGALYDAWVAPH